MPASLKIPHLADTGAYLWHHRFAVSGLTGAALVLLVFSAVSGPTGLHSFTASPVNGQGPNHSDVNRPSTAANGAGSVWAGRLESPHSEGQATILAQQEAPLTSSAYTSGFDRQAAGLDPLPPAQQPLKLAQPRDPRACPDNLNCSFRPAKASAVPPRRPLVAAANAPAAKAPAPNGFAVLTASLHLPTNLPSASALLKPFTFVGNSVAGFVKKFGRAGA